jgi:hypothetical protein
METVKRSFTLRRLRNVLYVTLLIAASIAALGPIGSSRAISQAGSASPEENGRGRIDPSGVIGATPLPAPSCGPCSLPVVLDENFDNMIPLALPPDWLATNALGMPPLWVTSNSGLPAPPADTAPNAAFIDDPPVVSDKRLDSLHFPVAAASAQLAFRHNFNLEASDVDPNLGFDGGVLEISFDGGNTFQDILVAGGTFVMGGYNRTISTDRGSPIAGRQVWSGDSEGFITTVVNLPFIPAGSAGGWAAITVAPAKAGALTPSISVGANRFRVVHRLLDLTLRRNHAPCRLHHQARTRRPRLLRHLALVRDSCLAREAGASQNAAGGSRATSTGRSRDRASGSERVKRPTTIR